MPERCRADVVNTVRGGSAISLGEVLGWFAVAVGVWYVGLGLACFRQGERLQGMDGLIFGGLALVAGWVIRHCRVRTFAGKAPGPPPAERGE